MFNWKLWLGFDFPVGFFTGSEQSINQSGSFWFEVEKAGCYYLEKSNAQEYTDYTFLLDVV